MPRIIRAPKRLIDLDDIAALLVELADGHALVYDHDTGTFGLVELAAAAHASRHQSGGADAVKLDDLAAPDDNTDLNATTDKHGLLPKLAGGTTNFLRADGTWAAAGGAGASFSDAEGDPAAVAGTAADGTSTYAARRDHVHVGATADHNHDAAYSAAGHDHDADYSATGHSHAHDDLTDVGTDDHHAQQHTLTGMDHTASGLTTGHFLKATSATGFGFAAHGLGYADVGAAASAHTHEVDQRADVFSDAEGDPAAVAGTAADGVSTYAARRDHAHTIGEGVVTGAMLESALDLGGKTSVEIPNGAGGTTVDAAGEVTVDTTSRTLNFYDGTAEVVLNPVKQAAFLLDAPVADDDLPIVRFDVAVTLVKVVYAISGGTNWVGQLQEADDAQGTNAADTQSADSTVTGNTTVTSFSNASFDAGDYARLKTASVSGSVTWLHVTLYWRENA